MSSVRVWDVDLVVFALTIDLMCLYASLPATNSEAAHNLLVEADWLGCRGNLQLLAMTFAMWFLLEGLRVAQGAVPCCQQS